MLIARIGSTGTKHHPQRQKAIMRAMTIAPQKLPQLMETTKSHAALHQVLARVPRTLPTDATDQ
jgi:hypothetical protein